MDHSKKLVVAKFGGTSVQDAPSMLRSAQVALKHNSSLVVVSATAGTTNTLVDLAQSAHHLSWPKIDKLCDDLLERHIKIAKDLSSSDQSVDTIRLLIKDLKIILKGVHYLKELTPRAFDGILSFGERISSVLFADAINNVAGVNRAHLVDAREIIKTCDSHNKAVPDPIAIKINCQKLLHFSPSVTYVSQGFIGSSADGHTTTLGRGGSDSSAALFAEGIGADILQIWTDVAGVATTDPRSCEKAQAIKEITYLEAAEMAQYGAKVLHPKTIAPAMRAGIEIFVGSSFAPESPGTWIRTDTKEKPTLRAITKRGEQSLLTIKTPEMLNAYGFLGKIFDKFKRYLVSVDCVTTSETSVALTVDKSTLEKKALLNDLAQDGEVKIESGFALISIIGNKITDNNRFCMEVFRALDGVNIRMICLGASSHNFCILVKEEQADLAVKRLHADFIEKNEGGQA